MVLKSLQELFPQVDNRILKAASIEHANNLDAAVEFILLEVLPFLSEPTNPSDNGKDKSSLHDTGGSSREGLDKRTNETSNSSNPSRPSSVHLNSTPYKIGVDALNLNESNLDDSQCLYNSIVNSVPPKRNGSNHQACTQEGMSRSSSSESRIWDMSVLIANNKALSQGRDSSKYSDRIKEGRGDKVELKEDEPNGSSRSNDCPFELEVITRSAHSVDAEFLGDIVSDAKNSKTSLLASVEMLTTMLKDVVRLEEKAKSTKEEISSTGQNTFAKVEELRQMLTCAKEANDMHAGEVYGERSILSTEARELQSRLLSLSVEKNKSLEIIEEIHRALEVRLVAAEEEIARAEKEKREREELAHRALKEQEEMMNSIVEESKKLQQEAEENTKLREFLVERGHMVDSLHGEIAVICEDIIRLKEIVEGRLPMTKSILSTISSLSSSTTSASLSKSTASLQRDTEAISSEKRNITTVKEIPNGDGSSLNNSAEGWELCVKGAWTRVET